MKKIKVLIVDDDLQVRDALKSILNREKTIEVVGEASDAKAAVGRSKELQPDVVLVDSQMPEVDGIEITRRIKQATPNVKVLFLTVHAEHIEPAVAAGADAYLFKDSGRKEILEAIKSLIADG